MTNIEDTERLNKLLLSAAGLFDSPLVAGVHLDEDQSEFLGFLLRTVANGRDVETIRVRAGQFARSLGLSEEPSTPSLADDLIMVDNTLRGAGPRPASQVKALCSAFEVTGEQGSASYQASMERMLAVLRYWGACPDPEPRLLLRAARHIVARWQLLNQADKLGAVSPAPEWTPAGIRDWAEVLARQVEQGHVVVTADLVREAGGAVQDVTLHVVRTEKGLTFAASVSAHWREVARQDQVDLEG